jgi:orotate phosphoribosyltransferase
MLADYKREFIDFAIDQGVICFGQFELKSGRTSPYFFNAGEFKSGRALKKLGEYYAAALLASGLPVDCLFGPAYKGIPLVATTAIAMAQQHQIDIPYVFNRKEAKDHGEGGSLVGAPLAGDVVIIDDVITAGTAIREVMTLFEGSSATARGVLVAIDRQERGQGDLSAIQEVERDYNISVISVVNLDDIVQYLLEKGGHKIELEQIGSYRTQYGIAS